MNTQTTQTLPVEDVFADFEIPVVTITDFDPEFDLIRLPDLGDNSGSWTWQLFRNTTTSLLELRAYRDSNGTEPGGLEIAAQVLFEGVDFEDLAIFRNETVYGRDSDIAQVYIGETARPFDDLLNNPDDANGGPGFETFTTFDSTGDLTVVRTLSIVYTSDVGGEIIDNLTIREFTLPSGDPELDANGYDLTELEAVNLNIPRSFLDLPFEDFVNTLEQLQDGTFQEVNLIEGTQGNDIVYGTDGNDLFNLGEGRDVVHGSAGDDIINGGDDGYNQVDYDGAPSDYSFSRDDNGTITVIKPNGTDTLTDIGGIWFNGEQQWYAIEDLIEAPSENTFYGSVHDDILNGTSGNDLIIGDRGSDVIFGSAGDDILIGDGEGLADEFNQVIYQGVGSSSANFTFSSNDNGSVTVTSSQFGEDLYWGIDGVWFQEEGQWYSVEELVAL